MSLLISLSPNYTCRLLSSSINISQNVAWKIVSGRGQACFMSYTTFSTHVLSLQDKTLLNCISEVLQTEVGWYIYMLGAKYGVALRKPCICTLCGQSVDCTLLVYTYMYMYVSIFYPCTRKACINQLGSYRFT